MRDVWHTASAERTPVGTALQTRDGHVPVPGVFGRVASDVGVQRARPVVGPQEDPRLIVVLDDVVGDVGRVRP